MLSKLPKVPQSLLTTLILLALSQPLSAQSNVDEIYNFHRIDASLLTGGQVTPEQIPALKEAGVELVVNLAITDAERNGQEGFLVAEQGISYVHIPVIWDQPTRAELELFFDVMDARGERPTLVHCFANYRASAFTYLYRVLREGVPEAEARKGLDAIWTEEAFEKYPVWRELINQALAAQD